ncbi:HAD family hydrolase [Halonotius terrestris]|uniref:HAD family hydrolase n=1 Tax=Halonotius terrestris TaxID=2487750 RepID=A0A8J8TB85_9EURY|nr:HAD family hydrolase [Halonotius terrestris]TQQ80930.1 HAD family hydrolase [Halonotius terrestris]
MVTDEYDFWLFDLDGTLIDAEWDYIRRVFDEAGQRLGYRFSDHEAELIWHGLGGARNSLLQEMGLDPEAFWDAFHEIETPDERAAASRLHDDAAVLLATLDQQSVPVGLVTHCQSFLTGPVLAELGLADRFDTVVCCDEGIGWKPDPTPVRQAMRDLGVDESHRGVLAGDAAVDIGAAWNAGLDGVHVERHGHARRGRCVRGDYRVQSLTELLPATAADGGIDREKEV